MASSTGYGCTARLSTIWRKWIEFVVGKLMKTGFDLLVYDEEPNKNSTLNKI